MKTKGQKSDYGRRKGEVLIGIMNYKRKTGKKGQRKKKKNKNKKSKEEGHNGVIHAKTKIRYMTEKIEK